MTRTRGRSRSSAAACGSRSCGHPVCLKCPTKRLTSITCCRVHPMPMDGYIRVSTVRGRSGAGYISPAIQREAIERWAAYKDIEIVQWHVDEDQSGGTHDRPGLNEAVERAVTGQTGGIVSWRIDRFSRFTEGGLRDLRRLEEAGARLAFVTEDIDTSGPMGRFVY